MLRQDILMALMLECHEEIFQESKRFVAIARNGPAELTYPADVSISSEEIAALKAVQIPELAAAALRKCFEDAVSRVLFGLFNVLDGSAGPKYWDYDKNDWPGVALIERPKDDEDEPLYHDEFYGTYDQWETVCEPRDGSPADGAKII
jgi:hypothetical protein